MHRMMQIREMRQAVGALADYVYASEIGMLANEVNWIHARLFWGPPLSVRQ